MSQDEEQIDLAEPPAVIDLEEAAGQEAAGQEAAGQEAAVIPAVIDLDEPAAAAVTLEPPGPTEEEADEADPLHIGNLLMIVSGKLGTITGRVTFRSLTLVRVTPQESSNTAIELPLLEDGTGFTPDLEIGELEIIETQSSDYYVDTLGARPGEHLEFFTSDGSEAAPVGIVATVTRTADEDSITLEDGRTFKFQGEGPQPPISVIRVTSASNAAAATVKEGQPQEQQEPDEGFDVFSLLQSVMPSTVLEDVPLAEMRFSDSIQREDMFQDLLKDLKPKQRTNPRRIRLLEREVDLSISLKNKILRRGVAGQIEVVTTSVLTMADALAMNPDPLPAAIPIVSAARILNLDKLGEGRFKETDVAPRVLTDIETAGVLATELYEEGTAENRDYYAYVYGLLGRDLQTMKGAIGNKWQKDQDVIRTAGYNEPVQGLSYKLPKAIPVTADKPSSTLVSTSQLIFNVHDRSIRALKEDSMLITKTGARTLIAPSDPSTVKGYMILPLKAALTLRPPTRGGDLPSALLYSAALQDDNLPTIAATLTQLNSMEAGNPHQPWTLDAAAAADFQIAEWLRLVLPFAVHPADALGGRTSSLLNTFDTLGLNVADLSPPVAEVLHAFVAASQKEWRTQLVVRRKAIQEFLDAEPERTFQSVTGADSPLWSDAEGSLVRTPALMELLEDVRRRNPTIAGSPTLLTASFLLEAQGDATPLIAAAIATMDARPLPVDPVTSATGLAQSRAYALRRKALQDIDLLRLRAEPEINTCPHAKKLEAIRNIRDNLERSRLLREFVELYQGEDKGSWMTCALCSEPCVCYHELLELEAMAQPARLETIQKQIMIRFGGERYQGKIVCKNCGQPLRDIDYAEGPEYDDEGNVVVTRSVLTEDQLREDPEESNFAATVRDMIRPTVEFSTETQRALASALDVILDRAGIQMDPDVIRQTVRYADLYVSARTPPPAAYEASRKKAMTAASAKIKTTTGVGGSTVAMPTYEAVIDILRVSALGSLVVLALQMADPPVVVNNPFPICPFSRGGWPLEEGADPDPAKGALHYVSCVVASIDRDEAPWMNMTWAAIDSLESRKKKVGVALVAPIKVLLGLDEKGVTLSVTPEIRSAMQRSKSDVVALKARALISKKDELPNRFRPEPFPEPAMHPVLEGAIPAAPTPQIREALEREARAVITGLHEADALRPVSLQEAGAGLLQGVAGAGIDRLQAIFAAPPTDPRLWPTFDTPIPKPIEQIADPAAAFKLFIKYCYYGPAVGQAHEFSYGNACRQCGLELGAPLELVDIEKEGARILSEQKGPLLLPMPVADETFTALSNAVRRRRLLEAPPPVEPPAWRRGLQELVAVLRLSPAYEEVVGPLEAILANPALDTTTDELERGLLWSPLTVHMDELLAEITERIGPLVGGGKRGTEASVALATFKIITEEPFLQGPRVLQEYWCAKAMAAGTATSITTAKGSKWFRISKQHSDLINKMLTENAVWFTEAVQDGSKIALRFMATALGPVLRSWIDHVKPSPTLTGWTLVEAQILLRTLVYQVWRDAVISTSRLWTPLPSPLDGAAQLANWTRGLMLHIKKHYIRYSKDRIQQILQQIADLDRESIVKEFRDSNDEDVLGAMIFMKQQGIGRWAVQATTKKYDADLFEFEATQREAQGRGAAPPVDPAGLLEGEEAVAVVNDFGAMGGPAVEDGYNVAQQADDDGGVDGGDAGFTAC
jgi:hypothetical protein